MVRVITAATENAIRITTEMQTFFTEMFDSNVNNRQLSGCVRVFVCVFCFFFCILNILLSFTHFRLVIIIDKHMRADSKYHHHHQKFKKNCHVIELVFVDSMNGASQYIARVFFSSFDGSHDYTIYNEIYRLFAGGHVCCFKLEMKK